MFDFNKINRVFRAKAGDSGDDLGIASSGDADLFAGADKEWAESGTIEDFNDAQELSNASGGGIEKEPNADELPEEEEGEKGDETEEEEGEEEESEDEEESEEEDEEKSEEEDEEESEEEDEDEDDEEESEEEDEDEESGDIAIQEFSSLAESGDKLSAAMSTASSATFDLKTFKSTHKDKYDTMAAISKEYQQALIDEEVDVATEKSAELFDIQSELQAEQAREVASSGASITAARGKLQAGLEVAITKAASIYPALDSKSDKKNPALIRVVNSTFKNKVSEGIPHIRAFVEAVEEIAIMKGLQAKGTVPKEKIEEKASNKKKQGVKKRLAAAKSNPKRAGKKNSSTKKLSSSKFKNATGDAFFNDSFVKDLGIKTDDF